MTRYGSRPIGRDLRTSRKCTKRIFFKRCPKLSVVFRSPVYSATTPDNSSARWVRLDHVESTSFSGRINQLFFFFFLFSVSEQRDHRLRRARRVRFTFRPFISRFRPGHPQLAATAKQASLSIAASHRYRRPAMNRHRRNRIRQGYRCPSPLSSCRSALLLLLLASSSLVAAASSRSRRTLPSTTQIGVGPVRLCKPIIYMKTDNGQVPNQLNPGQCLRHRLGPRTFLLP